MTRHIRNIRRWHKKASPDAIKRGRAWYKEAQAYALQLSEFYGVKLQTAAGVLAALSPRSHWSVNQAQAGGMLYAAAAGKPCPRYNLKANRRKAWQIAKGADPASVLSGPKVRAFYHNILGDLTHVTVDVWAFRAAGGKGDAPSPAQYDAIAEAYRKAAEAVNLAPAELQAIVWVTIRGRHA